MLAILLNNGVIDRLPNEALEQKIRELRIGLEFEFVRIDIFNINSIRFDSCGAVTVSRRHVTIQVVERSTVGW